MRLKMTIALCLSLLWAFPGMAFTVEPTLANAQDEARAKALFYEIRCVVCQSEAIADSPASVAGDMRRLIREKIAAGQSDADIKTYLVSRYGDVILMHPPFKSSTLVLWFAPLLLLLAGGWFLATTVFRKGISRK